MAKGIYRRGNVWWICYSTLDGNIMRESSKSAKFREAEALLLQRKQVVADGKLPGIVKIKNFFFNDLVQEYLKRYETQKSYVNKANQVKQLMEHFGNLPLRHFSIMILEQYQTERQKKGNKPATVNRLFATLKHMLAKAVDWNMVEPDLLRRIRKVRQLPENNRRLRFLSPEESHALIQCCDTHLKPIVITALTTGMRKGEILGLKWQENIDLRLGLILLNQDQTKNRERKEIPINATLRTAIASIPRRIGIPYVFFNPSTGRRYKGVKRSFSTACRNAGIKDFRFHDLRHTFASNLVMAGVDLTTVKELLGHKDLTMTLRYTHLAPSHKAEAVRTLDKVLSETVAVTNVK